VRLSAFKASRLLRGASFNELNFDTGMAPLVERKERGEHARDHVGRGADPEYSGLPALEGTCAVHDQIGICQEPAALAKQILAFRRQLQASADALKERDAKFGLKRVYLARCGRLAEVQSRRRVTEPTSVCRRDERAKRAEVHGKSSTICMNYAAKIALDARQTGSYHPDMKGSVLHGAAR
jgi:hypothetical protein